MADYLEAYARDGGIPVRTDVRVLRLARSGDSYMLETTRGAIAAEHVVVATGYQRPKVPAFAADINPSIRQLSAGEYRNSSQLTGEVLVVGAGTSGLRSQSRRQGPAIGRFSPGAEPEPYRQSHTRSTVSSSGSTQTASLRYGQRWGVG